MFQTLPYLQGVNYWVGFGGGTAIFNGNPGGLSFRPAAYDLRNFFASKNRVVPTPINTPSATLTATPNPTLTFTPTQNQTKLTNLGVKGSHRICQAPQGALQLCKSLGRDKKPLLPASAHVGLQLPYPSCKICLYLRQCFKLFPLCIPSAVGVASFSNWLCRLDYGNLKIVQMASPPLWGSSPTPACKLPYQLSVAKLRFLFSN